ncbi:hypothetical protein V2A60_000073 [Cordyceps javanica]|uniref:Uncharacterized protein n=1 Tax=Cordyceps javanica TaxID=43265 RepID=A0A545V6H8_9HYPO|nr:hypothetical protein IF1G_04543 [Cordyceps javanica]TQW08545.1 hypothetical protein IF2G_04421 [Cordyceps javanica]
MSGFGQDDSETHLFRASAALASHPPDYDTAMRHAQSACDACDRLFPNGALMQLYLALRWEQHAAAQIAGCGGGGGGGRDDWQSSLVAVHTSFEAYRLAGRHGGEGSWVKRAGERGVQRLMSLGVECL